MTNNTLSTLSAREIRFLCRSNIFSQPTTGVCPFETQANLLILPSKYAADFRRLCARNPVSCPLLGESPAPGDPSFPRHLAQDGDIRTDAPKYHIYMGGKLVRVTDDIVDEWEEDSVAFFIGCSFSFEKALAQAGLTPRHVEKGMNVSMYRTKIPLNPAGGKPLLTLNPFTYPKSCLHIDLRGNLIVSMRPYAKSSIPQVREITSHFMKSHGEPIAWGPNAAAELGIVCLERPSFGDPVHILLEADETPVFWGCGVTAQVAVMESLGDMEDVKIIGHAPGHMVCCDRPVDLHMQDPYY